MNRDIMFAKIGANKFLKQKGIDIAKLNTFSNNLEKIEYAKSVTKPSDHSLVEAIINQKYLPDGDYKFSPFYESNTRTAGDSAEWYRYFVQFGQGIKVEKEVHYDLSEYNGMEANILGSNDKITNKYRASDIVFYHNNKTIHQELKVGLWGSNLRGRIRDEIYADIIRLSNNENDEQEYRIYTNATTNKSLLNDKEQAKYLMKIAKMFPNRVRLYVDDVQNSLNEFGEKANLLPEEISEINNDDSLLATKDISLNLTRKISDDSLEIEPKHESEKFKNASKSVGKIFKYIFLSLFVVFKYLAMGCFYVVKYIGLGFYYFFRFIFSSVKIFVPFAVIVAVAVVCIFAFKPSETKPEEFYEGHYYGVVSDRSQYFYVHIYKDSYVWDAEVWSGDENGSEGVAHFGQGEIHLKSDGSCFEVHNSVNQLIYIFEAKEDENGQCYYVMAKMNGMIDENECIYSDVYLYTYDNISPYDYKNNFTSIKNIIQPGER